MSMIDKTIINSIILENTDELNIFPDKQQALRVMEYAYEEFQRKMLTDMTSPKSEFPETFRVRESPIFCAGTTTMSSSAI